MEWIDATKAKPEAGKPVLVAYTENDCQHWARACWVPQYFEEDAGNYCGDPDYNDADDTCYWPRGWYEWNRHEETHWVIDGEITHWALLDLPSNAGSNRPGADEGREMNHETLLVQGPVDVNVRGWIDQNDALPNDGQRVLCWEDFTSIGKKWQGVEVFYYRAGIGFVNLPDDDDAYGCIAHWMPLPEAPNVKVSGGGAPSA